MIRTSGRVLYESIDVLGSLCWIDCSKLDGFAGTRMLGTGSVVK